MSSASTADPDHRPAEEAAREARNRAARNRAADSPVLVVGLGNPLLGDDGVGWRVVDALERRLAEAAAPGRLPPLELDRVAVGGLGLMERLIGSERAILVDALDAGPDPPGTVLVLPVERASALSGRLDGAHDASLLAALDAGRAMAAPLPSEIVVVTVRAGRVDTFCERLSPEVARAVPAAVEAVLAVLLDATGGSSQPL